MEPPESVMNLGTKAHHWRRGVATVFCSEIASPKLSAVKLAAVQRVKPDHFKLRFTFAIHRINFVENGGNACAAYCRDDRA